MRMPFENSVPCIKEISESNHALTIVKEVHFEVGRASKLFPPFNSAHEGYGVLKEEVDELWDEIKKKKPDTENLRKEAIQVAAMAVRFVLDVTDQGDKG